MQLPPCDVLVCSVGLRESPIVLTTLLLRPQRLYLLHSQESRRNAEKVRDDPAVQSLGLDPAHDIVLREISLTDAPSNYGTLREIVTNEPQKHIVIDVSGGVKVMGVSLSAAAFWQRLPVVYLMGEEIRGIIRPFSEVLTVLQNPYEHFGDTGFGAIKAHFSAGDYDAARTVCHSLRDTVGDVAILGQLDILEELINLYVDWDAFAHSRQEDSTERRLATRLRVLMGKLERLNYWPIVRSDLVSNLEFLNCIEQSWQNVRNNSEPYRMVDIYCAAERRAKAGKYDDAIARLYRCLEMSATICLKRDWEIDTTEKPDYAKLTAAVGDLNLLRTKFAESARYALPERLGLNDQMTLLAIGGQHHPIFGIYEQLTQGKPSSMECRNRSTLAHGTIPVTAEIYQHFSKKTAEIIVWVIGKNPFKKMLKQATHPNLHL